MVGLLIAALAGFVSGELVLDLRAWGVLLGFIIVFYLLFVW